MSSWWNWIEETASDAKDWIEDEIDDAESWIEDKTEGTPLAGLWDVGERLVEEKGWGYVEDTLGDTASGAVADVWHGRTDDLISTGVGLVADEAEGTWVEDVIDHGGDVVDAIQEGPQAVAGMVTEVIGEQVEGTWAAGIWGKVEAPATGLATAGVAKLGEALDDTVAEDGFQVVAGIADVGATDTAAAPESAEATPGAEDSPLAQAGAGRGIVPDDHLAVQPHGEPGVDRPSPLADALTENGSDAELALTVVQNDDPAGETMIPLVVGAEASVGQADAVEAAPEAEEAAAADQTEATPVVPEVIGTTPASETAPAVEAAPAVEPVVAEAPADPQPTELDVSLADADASEASVDDMFSGIG
ncbi:MAG: hypothetical protein AAGA99_03170 [Actinomycetota bacterium]